MLDETKAELFVGIRIGAALERQLDESNSRYDHLLEGRDAQSLRRVTIDGQEVLGRSMEQGTTVDSVDDIVRNLRSILLKTCPKYNPKNSEIKIYTRMVMS